MATPGPRFIIPDGFQSIVCGSNGKVAVKLPMVNIITKVVRLSYISNIRDTASSMKTESLNLSESILFQYMHRMFFL
jgi:hypothetical protein